MRGRTAGSPLRTGFRLVLVAVTCVLAGCAMPPATEGAADPGAAAGSRLRPLSSGLAIPPGVSARSNVPSVRYDLAVSGTGELTPDDGVPGDSGPREIFERGGASWYGIQFHQRKTASGERFDMSALTAAHKTLPFNTRVCVRSLVNGSEVLVRINDRGPYAQGRVIDLSRAAAERIGLIGLGIKQVALSVVGSAGMRCGGVDVEPGDAAAPVAPGADRAKATVPARRKAVVPQRRRR
ncbi:rare lipoprotein A [Variovorax boronicumulans]|nr:rare lipoprotein A [Variovorax boronicumulans]MDQ0605958.1 rare lipoprotein A [Variovorax sp. W1I1]